jgi:hypothetical protein
MATVEVTDSFTELRLSPDETSFLTDGLILQRYAEVGGSLQKVMTVVKIRARPHSAELRGYAITDHELVVGECLTSLRGIVELPGTKRLLDIPRVSEVLRHHRSDLLKADLELQVPSIWDELVVEHVEHILVFFHLGFDVRLVKGRAHLGAQRLKRLSSVRAELRALGRWRGHDGLIVEDTRHLLADRAMSGHHVLGELSHARVARMQHGITTLFDLTNVGSIREGGNLRVVQLIRFHEGSRGDGARKRLVGGRPVRNARNDRRDRTRRGEALVRAQGAGGGGRALRRIGLSDRRRLGSLR